MGPSPRALRFLGPGGDLRAAGAFSEGTGYIYITIPDRSEWPCLSLFPSPRLEEQHDLCTSLYLHVVSASSMAPGDSTVDIIPVRGATHYVPWLQISDTYSLAIVETNLRLLKVVEHKRSLPGQNEELCIVRNGDWHADM